MGKSASFGSSELTKSAGYSSSYVLTIKQEPGESKAIAKQEKARGAKWPLDPPPVLQLTIDDERSQSSAFLHSPFWFCNVEIDVISHQGSSIPKEKLLIGTTVSSLHRVKHNDRTEKGYFIFGDLNIRAAGTYRLKFSLFEMRQGNDGMFAEHLGSSVHTKQFQVHASKYNLTLRESTPLSKALCEAGVKLRIRKEPTRRHRSGPVDWSNRQGYGGLHPQAALPPPSQTYSQLSHTRAGEDITSRISLSNTSLLDKSMMGQSSSQLSPSTLWHSPPANWPTRDHFDVPTTTLADYTSSGYAAAQYVPTTARTATPFRLYAEPSGELVQLPPGSGLTHFDPSAYSTSTGDVSESLIGTQGQYSAIENYGMATYNMPSLPGSMGVPGGSNMAVGGIEMGSSKVGKETNAYLPASSTPVNPPQRGQGLPTPPEERRGQTVQTQNAGQYAAAGGYSEDHFTSQSSQGNPYYQG
ncbi:hypothetical protein DV736_g4225, partial [Chaetothyriales sp. CBS 134916]